MEYFSQILNAISAILPQMVVVGICLYYLLKKFSIDGVLLSLGAFFSLLITIFYVVVLPYLFESEIMDISSESYTIFLAIVNVISFFASVLFAVGLVLLVNKVLKAKSTTF